MKNSLKLDFLVYNHSEQLGGAQRSILELVNTLKSFGHEIIFVLQKEGPIKKSIIEGGHKLEINYHPHWKCQKREPGYGKYYYFKHRIKLVIAFLKEFFSSFKSHYHLVKRYNPDWIIINTSTIPLPIIVGYFLRKRTIVFARESLFSENLSFTLLFPRFLVKFVLLLSNTIFVPSTFLQKFLSEELKIKKTKILGNPISLYSSEDSSESFWERKIWRIGMLGYFCTGKGQWEVIKYFQSKPQKEYTLALYGSGFENNVLKNLAQKGEFFLHPFNKNQFDLFNDFDILINNGKDETFGRVTIEAMRMRKLVFGRRSGATPELIDHGKNGFLFDEIKEVFSILEELRLPDGKIKIMGITENGFKKSLLFEPSLIAEEFLNIINK